MLDEVQTGLARTGKFLAMHHYDIQPDIVILAKALSGGLVPVGAVLMSDEVYEAVYSSLKRAIVHTSTYSENALAMRAGLATLEVIEREDLVVRAEQMGAILRGKLERELSGYEMVREIRGKGLFCGIEFCAPKEWRLRASFEAFREGTIARLTSRPSRPTRSVLPLFPGVDSSPSRLKCIEYRVCRRGSQGQIRVQRYAVD